MPDYTGIDNSSAREYIFYPRQYHSAPPYYAFDLPVPVDDDVSIVCRFYKGDDSWPWILFFHGNGEVVGDYDEISLLYLKRKLNLVVTDYRGYGASTGEPTLTDLVRDAPVLFRAVNEELANRGQRQDLWLMGRSLGSMAAIELAYHYPDQFKGLIIESGFPSIVRLILHLNIPAGAIELEPIYNACIEMIRSISLPALVIHGEFDTLVPLREAEDLYENLGTADKELIVIDAADHNDVMFVGLNQYFTALRAFIDSHGQSGGTE
ncbi:MAG: 2-succinyl-6-hydroxy-2,4-cyclohexadiene-1-carboxylate synthase [Syntrophorhabdus sp. PtaU1.Bin153]|nr:MAG: 2-succinyl-6-hydroxy-2,4-cyclohexadiene-1-carboxylate synthase [Syntrophorhabdus sp. PtaU1.Bin153]